MANTVRTQSDLLTVLDVCALYGKSRRTVYRWMEQGKIKGEKLGGQWVFTREAVAGLLKG